MSNVRFENVAMDYGPVRAVQSLDLHIQEGEFFTLLGPSGCGKTTTLRLIAGFITPSEGNIFLDETEITHLPPQHRDVGMVFQDYALFPHMTIAENIAFGLTERSRDTEAINARVGELLEMIELPDVAERYPSQISGGQQQRVAVARAVAYTPRVLLMDEPLGALDLKLRETMQIELRRIQQELGITTVYVTHDQSEAMNMSDTIVVMNNGHVEQVGSAEEIYQLPSTEFVAKFVGKINILNGDVLELDGDWATIDFDGISLRARKPADMTLGRSAKIAIRPEKLSIDSSETDSDRIQNLPCTVIDCRFAGNQLWITVQTSANKRLTIETRPGESHVQRGDSVVVSWRVEDALLITD